MGQLDIFSLADRVALIPGGGGGIGSGDTIFSCCQAWLMTSNVDQWIEALERIRWTSIMSPGHGPLVTLDHIHTQRAVLLSGRPPSPTRWRRAGREETIARVRFDDEFGPVDVGQGYMLDHTQNNNAGSLWDKLTATGYAEGR